MSAVLFAAVVALLAVVAPAPAQEQPAPAPSHESTHPHHLSFLMGAAHNTHLDEAAFTFGATYRYALAERFAVGPMAEFAFFDSETTTLLIAGVFWKPVGDLVLLAGPGVEFITHKGSSDDSHADSSDEGHASGSGHGEDEEGTKAEAAFRVGAGYEFHVGPLTLTPGLAADFVDSHVTMVYAVSVGVGF